MLNYELEVKLPSTVAGVDEAGRGPLAGPVVASAVILRSSDVFEGLNDSKKLSPALREILFDRIRNHALAFGIAIIGPEVIDNINILQAARLAMKRSVEKLSLTPHLLLIDGNQSIESTIPQQTLVQGDSRSRSIAAASILAKVTRDRLMEDYHQEFPQYAFNQHKGYGTFLHRQRIREFGPCSIHRKTFKGVREFLD